MQRMRYIGRLCHILTYFELNIREVIEVGRVVDRLDLNRYGSRTFSDVLPVDATKERYCWSEIVDTTTAVAETAVWFATESGDCVTGLLADGHFGWEAQRFPPVHNLPVRFLWIFAAERRVPCKLKRPNS